MEHVRSSSDGDATRFGTALISAGHCYLFLEELRVRGLDATPCLAAAGLAHEDIRLDNMIDQARFLAFVKAVDATAQDPDFGLHAGQRLELRAMDLLGLLLRSSKDGRQACQTFLRYGDLWRAARDVDVSLSGTQVVVRHEPLAIVAERPRILTDMVLSRVVRVARILRASADPSHVQFAYPRPNDTREHERLFASVTIAFDAADSVIVFAGRDSFDEPLQHHDPVLQAVLEPHVQRAAAAAAPAPTDTVGVVRHLLLGQLSERVLSFRDVADTLHRSERNLRRQLRELGTNYHDLLEEIRKEKAIAHRAANPHDSGVQLSAQLGFSEPAVFYRAFKRWTGLNWSSRG